MSIPRLIFVLLSALTIMLTVVILRTEKTRCQYQISKIDHETESIQAEIRERELELARLGNPSLIRERLAEMLLEGQPKSNEPAKPVKPGKPAGRP